MRQYPKSNTIVAREVSQGQLWRIERAKTGHNYELYGPKGFLSAHKMLSDAHDAMDKAIRDSWHLLSIDNQTNKEVIQ
jgi:hypothetical protein